MGVTLALGLPAVLVILTSGSAPIMMGETAEQWTAQELRPLRKHGWKLVNHFGLGLGDQDHVVVGPTGVVLVETKWGGTPWDVDVRDVRFQQAVEQTARNAKQLGLWTGVAKHGRPSIDAVLAVWGPAARQLRELPAWRHESGVVVLSGDQLQETLLRRQPGRLTEEQVRGIFEDIDRHLVRRDEREQASRPLPPSVRELASARLIGLLLGLGGYLVTHLVSEATASLLAWGASGAALLGVAERVSRRTRLRWRARSAQAGLVLLHLLTAVAVLRVYLHH